MLRKIKLKHITGLLTHSNKKYNQNLLKNVPAGTSCSSDCYVDAFFHSAGNK